MEYDDICLLKVTIKKDMLDATTEDLGQSFIHGEIDLTSFLQVKGGLILSLSYLYF
jgi:hypothetical protein